MDLFNYMSITHNYTSIYIIIMLYVHLQEYSMIISTLLVNIYSNVTEQDMNNLRKLAEQQKSQQVLKIKKIEF